MTITALAQEKLTADDVLRSVQKKYSLCEDASALFVQSVTLRFGKTNTQSGTVRIKKGNKYRIETSEQKLIADGKNVWIVSPAENQVLIDAFKENARVFSPDKFLLGLPDDFTAGGMTKDSGLVRISLTPRASNMQTRLITSMTAWIDPDTWLVRQIEYRDRNQARFLITLSDIRFNGGISDNVFRFDPPAGMNVVDLRKMK